VSSSEQEPKLGSGRAIAVAWHLGWPITAGVLVGAWLDGRAGSAPLFTLVLGLGAFVGAVRRIIVLSREDES
jgi:F0F1-type ATP synthase assembly protein I